MGQYQGGLQKTGPVLAIEVAGKHESEQLLRGKAPWYLDRGADSVWLLFPVQRRVLILSAEGELDLGPGQQVPARAALPGLTPAVDELFEQVSR